MDFRAFHAVAIAAAVLVAGAASAQPSSPAGAASAASAPRGPGYGPGPRGGMMGPGGGRWGSRYTPGWGMMTPEERDRHHQQMAQARTQDECRKALDEHRALMQKRAEERGVRMPGPRRDACAGLPRQ